MSSTHYVCVPPVSAARGTKRWPAMQQQHGALDQRTARQLLLCSIAIDGSATCGEVARACQQHSLHRLAGWPGVMAALLAAGDDGTHCLNIVRHDTPEAPAGGSSDAHEAAQESTMAPQAAALHAVLRADGASLEARLARAHTLLCMLSAEQVCSLAV
jgi:hypothetical protein